MKILITIILSLLAVVLSAQQPYFYEAELTDFNSADQLFNATMFGASRTEFNDFIQKATNDHAILADEANFFQALAAKKLHNKDCVPLMLAFVKQHPQSPRRHDMLYFLGDYYLINNNHKEALIYFDQANPERISPELRTELLFKRGYCYFMTKKYSQALAQFDKINTNSNKYASAVKYYRAHVDYQQGNLNVALKAFIDLEKDPVFADVSRYYIAHISYLQEHYTDAIRYAEPLAKDDSKKAINMQRIVADSYFALNNYDKAVTAYQQLEHKTRRLTKPDHYHYGMALYFTANYNEAIEELKQVLDNNDETAQNAHYHLADCYLHIGDKKKARTAFDAASKPSYDKAIREDAHFQKLKLAYELNFSPFSELITEFLTFIERYPNSDKIDEAYDYMSKAFLTTKNYRQALVTMEKIKHKNLKTYTALQRLAFFRALELYTDQKFDEAQQYFDYSLKYGSYDPKLKARAYYWKGECAYRTNQIDSARQLYNRFILSPPATETEEFTTAHYNLAYTYFNEKDYQEAYHWFIKYVSLNNTNNERLLGDAYNRLGDCLYIQRHFDSAVEYYDKALATSPQVGDYSMLQKAICLGLSKDNQQKIEQLDQLIATYPSSQYLANAYYEKARAHVALNQIKDAIYNYKVVKERYPRGSLASKSMLQLGLLYYNNDEYDNSMAFYKRVVNEYPSTPEATDALAGLRNVYMERGDYDGYIAYTKTLGAFARVELHEQDSLLYTSAERLYLKQDFTAAQASFERYLSEFNDGRFTTNANFYLANCHDMNGNEQAALQAFDYVANQPRSIFTEDALIRSGEIYFKQENYAKALDIFNRLEEEAEIETNKIEAIIGQMRCNQRLNNPTQCIASADKVIDMPQTSPEILREAKYIKAKSLIATNQEKQAEDLLKDLAENTKSAEGAEAKYLLAQAYFDQNLTDKAEKEVFDYVEKGTPHQYWLARSFILLADIYHQKAEDFQALQYLESLSDNYNADDDITEMIEQRLQTWHTSTSMLPDDDYDYNINEQNEGGQDNE